MIKDVLRDQFKVIMNTKYEEDLPICVFDRCMRRDGIAEELLKYLQEDIRNEKIPNDVVVICSGKFGPFVVKIFEQDFKVIHVKGGLRYKDSRPPDLGEISVGKEFVFVDDSMHTGRTQSKIVEAVEKQNGKVIASYYGFIGGRSPWVKYIRGILTREEANKGGSNDGH